jgi:hypothetical protein
MYAKVRAIQALSLLSALAIAAPVVAAGFPDVSTSHTFYAEIDELSDRDIIKGNPDGTFAPMRTVNRAEMLMLLYRASEKTHTVPTTACFKDVPAGEWYSSVVCDAVKNGYVAGYPDGNFRPAQEVNRVEALKMVHTVLGIKVDVAADMPALSDVPDNSWFESYVRSAYGEGILPVSGIPTDNKLNPAFSLTRGEAAAYIFNALGLESTSSRSSASSASTRSSRSSYSSSVANTSKEVGFPFSDDGTFVEKQRAVYSFEQSGETVASMKATVPLGNTLTCRLYKIDPEEGFALEYYLGYVNGNECSLRIALGSGDYQFEVSPGTKGITYSIESTKIKGDGNDGFIQAQTLQIDSVKPGIIETEDLADWYTFKVTQQKTMTIELTNLSDIKCLVYPMGDVDLNIPEGPTCNAAYEFPVGTYYVGVIRKDGKTDTENYSIRLK